MRFNRNRALIIGVAAVALVAGCEEPAVTDLSESRGPAAAQQEEVKTRDYVDSIALPGAWAIIGQRR